MPSTPALLWIAERVPVLFDGGTLHRAGLAALARGACASAERLFERAASAYRRRLDVEALAQVRVHQMMARARLGRADAGSLTLEIERSLYRLRRIRSLEPPFEVVDARLLLAGWAEPEPERAAA